MAIILPVPPSGNLLYRTIRVRGQIRHVRSKAWKDWLKTVKPDVDTAVATGHLPVLNRHISAVYIVANVNHRRDIDNLNKPVLDALTECGVIDDDRWCNRCHVDRITPGFEVGLPVDHIRVTVERRFPGCPNCPEAPSRSCLSCGRYLARDRRK